MKRILVLVAAAALFTIAPAYADDGHHKGKKDHDTATVICSGATELVTVYGPVYIVRREGQPKEAKIEFTALKPGCGKIVVKNGGTHSDRKHKVTSAEIRLNDIKVARPEDFNKKVDVLTYDVTLLAENELEIEVRSGKETEIEVSILGEPAPPPPREAFPARTLAPLR